jgi:hypothetical protein
MAALAAADLVCGLEHAIAVRGALNTSRPITTTSRTSQ